MNFLINFTVEFYYEISSKYVSRFGDEHTTNYYSHIFRSVGNRQNK